MLMENGHCTLLGWRRVGIGPNCTKVAVGQSLSEGPSGADIVVSGCAKNIEHHKRDFFALLRALQALGSALFIYEDGSADKTRRRLIEFANRSATPMRLYFADAVAAFLGDSKREQKIALCRHTLLREAMSYASVSRSQLTGHALMISVDLDCAPPIAAQVSAAVAAMMPPLPHPLDTESIGSAWDVLTAAPGISRGAPGDYYDHSALRAPVLGMHFNYDCWTDLPSILERGNCLEHRITISERAPIFGVESAFNGLAIYSLARVHASGCGYLPYYLQRGSGSEAGGGGRSGGGGGVDAGEWVARGACEHVGFHRCLRSHNLTIGIAPALHTGCWPGWRSKRSHFLASVHVHANGTVRHSYDFQSPKSTTRVADGKRAMLLAKAKNEAAETKRLAVREMRRWQGSLQGAPPSHGSSVGTGAGTGWPLGLLHKNHL